MTMFLLTFQTGVSRTPNFPWLVRLRLTNLLLTPFAYTHNTSGALPTDPNNLICTNAGQNIGPSIRPHEAGLEGFTASSMLGLERGMMQESSNTTIRSYFRNNLPKVCCPVPR